MTDDPRSTVPHHTFDVFDTAITRLVDTPDHVHFSVGRKLRAAGIIDVGDAEWRHARVEAEHEQRGRFPHREVALAEIYARLAGWLELDDDQARAARETELAEEARLMRPIASTVERVSSLVASGEPVHFISDTYLSADQVADLLAGCGYTRPLDVFSSSDHRLSKADGSLFPRVAELCGAPPSAFRHTGDNVGSDVVHARANGWTATLFADSHRTVRESVLAGSGDAGFLASVFSGSARAARLGQLGHVPPGVATGAATVVGPLLTAYALWIVRDLVARGERKVYFLARDGQVLAQIAQRLADWAGLDLEMHYLLGSRQAFLLPAIPTDDDERMVAEALDLAYYDATSLRTALTALGYDDSDLEQVVRSSAVPPTTTRHALTDGQLLAVRRALGSPEHVAALRERVSRAREATDAYLDAQGFFDSPRANIVDLGWRGTTQRRLERIAGDRVEVVGHYLGLSNTVLTAESSTRVCWTSSLVIKTSLIEVMAAADHTSIKGFELDGKGSPVAVPPVRGDDLLLAWGARQQQQIAVRFAEYLTAAVDLDAFSLDEVEDALRSAATDAYRHFCTSPTPDEAEAYGGIEHAVDVNHVDYRELAQVIASRDLLRHVVDRSARGAASSWYLGSLARSGAHLLPRVLTTGLARVIALRLRLDARSRRRATARAASAALSARYPAWRSVGR